MSPDNVHKQISDYLTQYAREAPEREAVVFGDQRLNYTQLRNQVLRCAKALLALNVKKGDRIAVLCTSRTAYWVVFLATTSIGAIWLGLNPKYRLQELRYLLQDAGLRYCLRWLSLRDGVTKRQSTPCTWTMLL